MNRTARRETQCRQAVHKLITSLHSKRYRPSGMPIHRQNSYAPTGKHRTGHCEAQSREPVNNRLRGFSPPANYTDRATTACRRS
jgi:hypothetical protein